MKRLILPALLSLLCIGVAVAATGINVLPVLITNTGATTLTAPRLSWLLSSQSFIDGSWMNATGLNTELQDGGVGVGYMPGTGQTRMLQCFNNAGVDETTACNNATTNDLTFPTALGQVYEFAGDSQFNTAWFFISTGASADWDIALDYLNSVGVWTALTGVVDGTDELRNTGLRRISWNFPVSGLWTQQALHGVTTYWVRIRVSAFVALTVAPLGQQGYYETGRWWTTTATMPANEQKQYNLHLDTSPTASTSTTVSIAASADDNYLISDGLGVYPPGFGAVGVGTETTLPIRRGFVGGYWTQDAYLRFDTSALPDQISPDTATLSCYVTAKVDADARNLVAEWYTWSSSITAKDYANDAKTTAHSGTAIAAITTGAVNNFTLQNLHRIVKSGYTGLRLSISGGAPAGDNGVTIASQDNATFVECSIAVTYDGSRAYHDFFPIAAGIGQVDNAALEPANNFELTMAGFFNTTDLERDILIKGTATEWTQAATGVFVWIGTSNVANFNFTNTGYHVLTLRQVDGDVASRVEAYVDGVRGADGISGGAFTIANNATDWTFFAGVPYIEYFQLEVADVDQIIWQIRDIPDEQLHNQAIPGSFEPRAIYPETNTGYTSTVLPLEPTDPDLLAGESLTPGDFLEAPGELTNLDAAEHQAAPRNLLFQGLQYTANQTDGAVPYQVMLVFVAFIISLGVMAASWIWFKSVFISWASLFVASLSFIYFGDGIWSWAVPATVALLGLPFLFYKRQTL